jgi:predicted porin
MCALAWSAANAAEFTFYGVGHLSFDQIDTGTSSSDYVHSNSSRLGLKGSQDLGDDLSVYAQYESGVDLTVRGTGDGNGGATSNGQLFTRARDSFLGLKHEQYGAIQFGRVGGLNQWLYDYNLFADQVGDLGNIWGGDGLPGRLDSTVEYLSPAVNGFRIDLTYVPGQGASNQRGVIVKADYASGGCKLGAAYANLGKGAFGTVDRTAFAITGSYDLGFFNVGGGYQRQTGIGGTPGADRNQASVGGAVKVAANGLLKAQYAWSGNLSGLADSGAQQIDVGFDYKLHKTTTVYIAYARTSNGLNSALSAYDYGHGDQGTSPIALGKTPSVVSVGMIYQFEFSRPESKSQ